MTIAGLKNQKVAIAFHHSYEGQRSEISELEYSRALLHGLLATIPTQALITTIRYSQKKSTGFAKQYWHKTA
ncbi:MAG: hypothetical protein IPN76_14725 [Saprospiraceae bacterium]|nr:hypothetical protein [Saprospiraceae bacterium]